MKLNVFVYLITVLERRKTTKKNLIALVRHSKF